MLNQLLPTLLPGQYFDDSFVFFDHFVVGGDGTTSGAKFATSADVAQWRKAVDNSGTAIISDAEPNGVLTLFPNTVAANYISIQLNGEAFATSDDWDLLFETRFKLTDHDDAQFFMGLAVTAHSTSSTIAPVLDGVTSSIGFRRSGLAGTSNIDYVVETSSTETTAASGYSTEADDTWYTLSFRVHQRRWVEFYVRGNYIGKFTTNIPASTVALTPTLEVASPTGTTATSLEIDYIGVARIRAK